MSLLGSVLLGAPAMLKVNIETSKKYQSYPLGLLIIL